MVDMEKVAEFAYSQIKKEHDLAVELTKLLKSFNLSAQEEFHVVQNFKDMVLGDVPLYH